MQFPHKETHEEIVFWGGGGQKDKILFNVRAWLLVKIFNSDFDFSYYEYDLLHRVQKKDRYYSLTFSG